MEVKLPLFRRTRPRIRALVLAAGLGTRLRPLTENLPKPLLPVAGRPLVELTLDALAAIGCEAVALNLHHLGDKIRAALGTSYRGMPLTWSEEPEILGTLGALGPLADFLGAADAVLVINGDSLCRWPLARLLRRHFTTGARVTLLLSGRADPARFGGGVGTDGEGRIVSFRGGGFAAGPAEHRRVFAGVHALAPDLLRRVEARPSDIITDLYEPLLAEGVPIRSLVTSRPWHDLGTPARYLAGLQGWIQPRWWPRWWPPGWPGSRRSWVSPDARVAPGAELERSLVEAGATVGEDVRLEGSLVLPGATIGAGSRLSGSMIDFGVELPPASRVHNRLVTMVRPGQTADPRDTVLGDFAYRPLG